MNWLERFWNRVEFDGPIPEACPELGNCWLWAGAKSRDYGHVRSGSKMLAVHRTAFEIQNHVAVPEDLDVCHRCDNPSCVRGTHLFAGNGFQNLQDAVRKGRARFHKVTPAQAREIRQRYKNGESQTALAVEFGVCQSNISKIVHNVTYKEEVLCASI
jgi:hypothetical protein